MVNQKIFRVLYINSENKWKKKLLKSSTVQAYSYLYTIFVVFGGISFLFLLLLN